ncbi:MAG: hypothetical protein KC777_03720 [Cyanobacteria bacterium HKST-UBA02]|nr:hypothetical protein [Cyanobacteria bacterium HKST-UBA02]
MQFKTATLSVLGGLTIILVTAGIFLESRDPPLDDFPPRPSQRIFLMPSDSAEDVRVEHYGPDGYTRIEATREYRDGTTEHVEFRDDGTIEKYTQYFPGESERRVKSHAAFDDEGILFTSHDVFRSDGTLERQGRRLKDGNYKNIYFYQNGVTPSRVRIFDGKRNFVSEKLFREDGSLLAEVRVTGKSERTTTLYHSDGSVWANIYKTMTGSHGDVFAADGKTIMVKFDRTPWNSQEDYYDRNGNLIQGRLTVAMAGTMDVFVFDRQGRIQLRQQWRKGRVSRDEPVTMLLSRVDQFREGKLWRTIDVVRGKKLASSVEYPKAGGKLVKELDDGGRVRRTIEYSGTEIKTSVPADAEVEIINQRILDEIPRESIPEFTDPDSPPLIYDYP